MRKYALVGMLGVVIFRCSLFEQSDGPAQKNVCKILGPGVLSGGP